jgi:predicted naringenin-chalcone synthase
MSHLFSMQLQDSAELIQWKIVDTGFEMTLSGEVPNRIGAALQDDVRATLTAGRRTDRQLGCSCRRPLDPRCGREGAELPQGALFASRDVLARYGKCRPRP